MIYFTSDLHFCHDKEFLYKPRGFDYIEEMNECIVDNWNNIIKDNDEVYILGDVILNDIDKGIEYLNKLNGEINIIIGNHDTASRLTQYKTLPNVKVLGYATILKYKKYRFYLCHYPTITCNLDEDKSLKQCLICLCGHTHFTDKFYNDIPLIYNVSCDAHECTPVSIETIIEDIKRKRNIEI